jgi:hypothetical protein
MVDNEVVEILCFQFNHLPLPSFSPFFNQKVKKLNGSPNFTVTLKAQQAKIDFFVSSS